MDKTPEYRHVIHTFPPVADPDCRILILGSVPSVKSMQAGFYYMHPQNRFWRVMEGLLGEGYCGLPTAERAARLLSRHVALYDSVYACDICGSSDSKVVNIVPSDIPMLMNGTQIARIFCNGKRSYAELLRAHPHLAAIAAALPSTSPANASCSYDGLLSAWRVVLEWI